MTLDFGHFAALATLVEHERAAERERLGALRGTLGPREREDRGIALVDLEATDERVGLGGRVLVTFERAGRGWLETPIGPGDAVLVTPRRAAVEEPWRGVISARTRTRLEIAFDAPPPGFVTEGRVVVDLVSNDVTFDRARAALAAFQTSSTRDRRLLAHRDVLLGRTAPRFEAPVDDDAFAGLNAEQRDAAARALAARDLFLVHGPPGTGKSTVLAAVAEAAVRRGERVLCAAASNAAVDHLVDLLARRGLDAVRIGHPARVSPRLTEHTLDARLEAHADRALARELFEEALELQGYARKQRARGRSRERHQHAREAQADARKLFAEARALERRAAGAILDGADVLCATLTTAAGRELEGRRFDLALCDEATQAIEPLALIPFLAAERVVLAGDHLQLGPTVLSRQAAALGTSLFERLVATHLEARRMLREQYRMHEDIMAFPSAQLYEGGLRAHPSVARRTLRDLIGDRVDAPPVLFLDTAGKGLSDRQPEGSESHDNPGEAELLAEHAGRLLAAGLDPAELAIVVPYRAQVALLDDLARARGWPEALEIDTVDAFQGREKDAVLVGLVRSNAAGEIGFLADLRRMNVAITRPRRHLFVVGDSATVSVHPFYRGFIDAAQAAGGYRSAWEW